MWAWLRLNLTFKRDHAKTDKQIRDIVIEKCEQRKCVNVVSFFNIMDISCFLKYRFLYAQP